MVRQFAPAVAKDRRVSLGQSLVSAPIRARGHPAIVHQRFYQSRRMPKVFLSYRRDDSGGYAGRIQDQLTRDLGADVVFMDVDGIQFGRNFVEVLHEEVSKCDVLLAVIGRNWLEARDENGSRRLDDPNDFVRIEIGAALQRKIAVVPILLEGVKIPNAGELPEDLKELAVRNGIDIRLASFHSDVDRLIQGLKKQLNVTVAPLEPKQTQPEIKASALAAVGAVGGLLSTSFMFFLARDSPTIWTVIDIIAFCLCGAIAGLLIPRTGMLKALLTSSVVLTFLEFANSSFEGIVNARTPLFRPADILALAVTTFLYFNLWIFGTIRLYEWIHRK